MAKSEIAIGSDDFLKRYPIIDCELQGSRVAPILSNFSAIMSVDRSYKEKNMKQFTRFDVSRILETDPAESKLPSSTTEDAAKDTELRKERHTKRITDYKNVKMQFKSDSEDQQFPSYTAMIAQAILSTLEKKLTLGGIYEFIELRYPGLERRVKGWRNCVRHNLSLNECFIKLGRSETGRGNDWAIHPSYLESFLRGEYRKRRACSKQRYDMVYIGGVYGYPTTDQLMQWASRYQYMQYVKSMNLTCVNDTDKRDALARYDVMKKASDRFHPYYQASNFQNMNCKCCCCLDVCRTQSG